jgi:antitoxin VapB
MARVTKLFLSNRSQALRIPAYLRLPDTVTEVELRTSGHERIISPLGRRWDSFFRDRLAIPDHFMSERASQEQAEREAL